MLVNVIFKVSHGSTAVLPLRYRSLKSTGVLHLGYETKAKALFISAPLQQLLCNPLLAHSCLWTTGSGLWGLW